MLERNVSIRCLAKDKELVESILDDCKSEYEQFIQDNTSKKARINLSIQDRPLGKGECELGGVILYCNNNRIVYTNTLDSRIDLCFQESLPLIRRNIFDTQKEKAEED